VVATVLTIIAYKKGDLSVLFPMASLSYLWGTLFAVKILKEKMNIYKYLAIFFVILGVIVIVQ
jgi:uncharacterized membrane protein